MMKNQKLTNSKSIMIFVLLLALLLAGLDTLFGQETETSKEKYFKIGGSIRSFNNSDLKEDIGEIFGLQSQAGVGIQKDLAAELIATNHWKTIDEDTKFNDSEIAFLLNYQPSYFYIGAGPALSLLTRKYAVINNSIRSWEHSNYSAIGFLVKIGYYIHLTGNFNLYGEFQYSKVNIEDDELKTDAGTFGVSMGLKLNYGRTQP